MPEPRFAVLSSPPIGMPEQNATRHPQASAAARMENLRAGYPFDSAAVCGARSPIVRGPQTRTSNAQEQAAPSAEVPAFGHRNPLAPAAAEYPCHEADDGRMFPLLDKREEMHARVTKIDVHQ